MQGKRILIVDDEDEVGEILSLRLERRGVIPYFAKSGSEALNFLAETPVDVVLLDVKMPEMDGITVLKQLVTLYPDTAVIMLSGHADMEVAAEGLQMGALFYLLKPIEIDSLCHKIEDACRQKAFEKTA